MVVFIKRQIHPETIGSLLKKTRESRGWSLEEVAQKINISSKHLKILEDDNYSLFPSQPYVYGFLKAYACFLELDARELISRLERENKFFQRDPARSMVFIKNNDFSKLHPKKISFFDFSKFLIFGSIFIILVYLGWSVWQTLSAPKISIFYPPDNLVTKDHSVEITGKINNREAIVFINGLMVEKNQAGQFSQLINLSPGLNVIKISAQKKGGREGTVWRRVILESENN